MFAKSAACIEEKLKNRLLIEFILEIDHPSGDDLDRRTEVCRIIRSVYEYWQTDGSSLRTNYLDISVVLVDELPYGWSVCFYRRIIRRPDLPKFVPDGWFVLSWRMIRLDGWSVSSVRAIDFRLTHVRTSEFSVNRCFFISLSSDPCQSVICEFYAICRRSNEGRGHVCECPSNCSNANSPVCGSDGKTYENECQLQRYSCINRVKITAKSMTACGKQTQLLTML